MSGVNLANQGYVARAKPSMSIHPFVDVMSSHLDLDQIRVIFDIGSRDAKQSIELATVFPQCEIYAFEASPAAIVRCQRELADHPRDNVSLLGFAVLDFEGETVFHEVPHGNVGASSVFEPGDDLATTITTRRLTVPCRRLDNWCDEQRLPAVDLLWMDVQGAELQVLRGLGSRLQGVKAIHTEVALESPYRSRKDLQPTLYPELHAFLTDLGFRQFRESANMIRTTRKIRATPQGDVSVTYAQEVLEVNLVYLNESKRSSRRFGGSE